MKKQYSAMLLASALIVGTLITPSSASEYFESSAPEFSDVFGVSTTYTAPVAQDPSQTNILRNKDAAVYPPPYGFWSGEIPTDYISHYHNLEGAGTSGWGESSTLPSDASGYLPSTSLMPGAASGWTAAKETAVRYYADGTIGSIYIPAIKLTADVREGTSSKIMMDGWGHFEDSTAWDGNVCVAGHNRGANVNVGAIKDLDTGDRIEYTTLYGTRTYEVFFVGKISNDNSMRLSQSSDENLLTLITCVANDASKRWCVQAREVS